MKLSIIIPVFNEEKTIIPVLEKVLLLQMPRGVQKELIIIDDGSRDATAQKIEAFLKTHSTRSGQWKKNMHFYRNDKNFGKGDAVRKGIEKATGTHVVIQDADLEYNPQDIGRMLQEVTANKRDVVYGTRIRRFPNLTKEEKTGQFLFHYFGNRFLSLITSLLYGQWITDMETCYKMFPKSAVAGMHLVARGFEFEPEITAKLIKAGYTIFEIPIQTKPRSYRQGKKLHTFIDGRKALWTLLKYRFVS